jgi:hypothetical protein
VLYFFAKISKNSLAVARVLRRLFILCCQRRGRAAINFQFIAIN